MQTYHEAQNVKFYQHKMSLFSRQTPTKSTPIMLCTLCYEAAEMWNSFIHTIHHLLSYYTIIYMYL